ncbi:hypothetical protein ACFQZ4_38725 [Catellatospora coxensis]
MGCRDGGEFAGQPQGCQSARLAAVQWRAWPPARAAAWASRDRVIRPTRSPSVTATAVVSGRLRKISPTAVHASRALIIVTSCASTSICAECGMALHLPSSW